MVKDRTNDLVLFTEDLANSIRRKLGKTYTDLPLKLYDENDKSKDMASVIRDSASDMGGFFNDIICNKREGIKAVESIIVFNNVTDISAKAYAQLANLNSVILPDGLLSIGEDAFNNCAKLSTIEMPATVERVGARAFNGTAWLKNYQEDVVYVGKACYLVNTKNEITVRMPNYIVSITDGAFQSSSIKEVSCDGSISYIGSTSFMGCSKLTKVEFLNTTADCVLNQQAFKGCTNLKEVWLGNLLRISHYVFQDCSSLESLYILGDSIPDSNEIWSGAFSDINHDVTIYVPSGKVDIWKSRLKSYSLDDNVIEYNPQND